MRCEPAQEILIKIIYGLVTMLLVWRAMFPIKCYKGVGTEKTFELKFSETVFFSIVRLPFIRLISERLLVLGQGKKTKFRVSSYYYIYG